MDLSYDTVDLSCMMNDDQVVTGVLDGLCNTPWLGKCSKLCYTQIHTPRDYAEAPDSVSVAAPSCNELPN